MSRQSTWKQAIDFSTNLTKVFTTFPAARMNMRRIPHIIFGCKKTKCHAFIVFVAFHCHLELRPLFGRMTKGFWKVILKNIRYDFFTSHSVWNIGNLLSCSNGKMKIIYFNLSGSNLHISNNLRWRSACAHISVYNWLRGRIARTFWANSFRNTAPLQLKLSLA